MSLLPTFSHQEQKGPNKDKLCSHQAEEQRKLTPLAIFITHLRAEHHGSNTSQRLSYPNIAVLGAKFPKSKLRRRHSSQCRICFQLAHNVIRCSTVLGYAIWIQKQAYFSPNMAIWVKDTFPPYSHMFPTKIELFLNIVQEKHSTSSLGYRNRRKNFNKHLETHSQIPVPPTRSTCYIGAGGIHSLWGDFWFLFTVLLTQNSPVYVFVLITYSSTQS